MASKKTLAALGKEAKLGLGVLAVLMLVFCLMLYKRLQQPKITAGAGKDKKPAAAAGDEPGDSKTSEPKQKKLAASSGSGDSRGDATKSNSNRLTWPVKDEPTASKADKASPYAASEPSNDSGYSRNYQSGYGSDDSNRRSSYTAGYGSPASSGMASSPQSDAIRQTAAQTSQEPSQIDPEAASSRVRLSVYGEEPQPSTVQAAPAAEEAVAQQPISQQSETAAAGGAASASGQSAINPAASAYAVSDANGEDSKSPASPYTTKPYANPYSSTSPASSSSYTQRQPTTAAEVGVADSAPVVQSKAPESSDPFASKDDRWNTTSPTRQAAVESQNDYTAQQAQDYSPARGARFQRASDTSETDDYAQRGASSGRASYTAAQSTAPTQSSPTVQSVPVRSVASQRANRPLDARGYDPQREEYTVQPGDNYWLISRRLFGEGDYFKAIQEHNREAFPNPGNLKVGDVLSVPTAGALREAYPQLCPKERNFNPGAAARTVSDARATGGRIYVVEEGDTLFDIARYELGRAAAWVEIFEMNREALSDDINYLKPGMKLVLPGQAKSVDDDEPTGTKDSFTRRPSGTYSR